MIDVRQYGRRSILVTPSGAPLDAALALRALGDARIRDIVPAAETVLVSVDHPGDLDSVAELVASVAEAALSGSVASSAVVHIDVVYDGPDLDEVAAASGLTVDEVVRRHSTAEYRCRFCGFAPGFSYLDGLDPSLVLPRRPVPRTSVAAGSVAIAGPFAAVYPTASPGGWNLLGRTTAVLWDADAVHPALLPPGARVRFRAVDVLPPPRSDTQAAPPIGIESRSGVLTVTAAGWASSIQDGGRVGLAHLGVPGAGAVDQERRHQLNRLIGNPADAAVIETLGGLAFDVVAPVLVADSASGAVSTLPAGATLRVAPGPGEAWATLAVRGGVEAPARLGSRSWDSLSRLGPPPLQVGDRLAVGPDPRTPAGELAPPAPLDHVVEVTLGPRVDWFTDAAVAEFLRVDWIVSSDVSRVGARLVGPSLARAEAAIGRELPSEGLVTGAIQVPPSGQPIVMLADHPTTGGYPVIAVVDDDHLAKVVRRRPGDTLRFRLVS